MATDYFRINLVTARSEMKGSIKRHAMLLYEGSDTNAVTRLTGFKATVPSFSAGQYCCGLSA